MYEIIIIGAGGQGRELSSYIHRLTMQGEKIRLVGFVDERKPRGPWGTAEILGSFDDLQAFVSLRKPSTLHYITAVGDNQVRRRLVQKVSSLAVPNLLPWTFRHPQSFVGDDVEIGEGTYLAPGSITRPYVKIGRHCILNAQASIAHDCLLEDFANISDGAVLCGNVRVGEGCFIGAGATIIPGISIGEWTVIGAGAMVTHTVPPGVTAVGVPARIIKRSGVPTFRG